MRTIIELIVNIIIDNIFLALDAVILVPIYLLLLVIVFQIAKKMNYITAKSFNEFIKKEDFKEGSIGFKLAGISLILFWIVLIGGSIILAHIFR